MNHNILRRKVAALLIGGLAAACSVASAGQPLPGVGATSPRSADTVKEQKLVPLVPAGTGVQITPVQRGKIQAAAIQVSLAGTSSESVAAAPGAVVTGVNVGATDDAGSPNIGAMILASLALMLWIAARRLGR